MADDKNTDKTTKFSKKSINQNKYLYYRFDPASHPSTNYLSFSTSLALDYFVRKKKEIEKVLILFLNDCTHLDLNSKEL